MMMFSEYTSLEDVRSQCMHCMRCPLHETREQVVFGAGRPDASLFFIGQGPSPTDNTTGRPYSGPASVLFEKALSQAELRREEIWLTNIHKCLAMRTDPKTQEQSMRPPKVAEVKACHPWLQEELYWVKPQVIVVIGGPAAKAILGKDFSLTEQRGQWHNGPEGLPTLATYQPTYLKRLSEWDRPAAVTGWRDLIADLRLAKERTNP